MEAKKTQSKNAGKGDDGYVPLDGSWVAELEDAKVALKDLLRRQKQQQTSSTTVANKQQREEEASRRGLAAVPAPVPYLRQAPTVEGAI
jgi:hypothetical protein